MAADDGHEPGVLVWFEDSPDGRSALAQAHGLTRLWDASLTVVAVAPHERVIGCGRCLQGTVVWNVEMKKIAHEELLEARAALAAAGAAGISYEVLVGDAADVIVEAAERLAADAVVLPSLRPGLLQPHGRRDVAAKVSAGGPWQVMVAPRAHRGERVGPPALTGTS
jgi:nucleotide-binding universal stress UspA family protein